MKCYSISGPKDENRDQKEKEKWFFVNFIHYTSIDIRDNLGIWEKLKQWTTIHWTLNTEHSHKRNN